MYLNIIRVLIKEWIHIYPHMYSLNKWFKYVKYVHVAVRLYTTDIEDLFKRDLSDRHLTCTSCFTVLNAVRKVKIRINWLFSFFSSSPWLKNNMKRYLFIRYLEESLVTQTKLYEMVWQVAGAGVLVMTLFFLCFWPKTDHSEHVSWHGN